MPESRLVPCRLMKWPKVMDLPESNKFFLYHLWVTCEETCGCQLFDTADFEKTFNFSRTEVFETIEVLRSRKLIAFDKSSGEIFILDWFRYHKFEVVARKRLLEDSLRRIHSKKLRKIVEKTMTRDLREGKSSEAKRSEVNQPPSCSSGEGKTDTSQTALNEAVVLDIDETLRRIVADEKEGRRLAIQRGDASPVKDWTAWCKALIARAQAGEDIQSEYGRCVALRREAEARYQQCLNANPEVDIAALEAGVSFAERHLPKLSDKFKALRSSK